MASSTLTLTTGAPAQSFLYSLAPEPPQSNKSINRHSCPSSNILWQKHSHHMQQAPLHEKPFPSTPSSQQYQQPPPSPTARAFPRLSLDTSQERLHQHKYTVVQHGDQNYLKLFSPTLVESPVSFLSAGQLLEDKKLWENGPDEAFQKKLDMERREAYQVRSRQQLRGFVLGIWLGCLMGLLIVQQTAAKVYIPSHLARRDTSPELLFMVFMSCVAAVRSGTRSMMAAIATCAAVLTCFATLIANQSRYSVEFRVHKPVQASSFTLSASFLEAAISA